MFESGRERIRVARAEFRMSPILNQEGAGPRCCVCVDMGTTNTRVWLVQGDQVLSRATASVGIRDSARDGSSERIRKTLRELVEEVRHSASRTAPDLKPTCIVAAGMITSSLGLCEVPHVMAPAGLHELRKGAQWFRFEDVSELPVFLIPGVRCGKAGESSGDVEHCDVMRGEETLCAGLIKMGLTSVPSVVLNIGSHWKAIVLDAEGRIALSVTSLSGEMIHAIQTQTVLASAVPTGRPTSINWSWCEEGMNEQRRSGLARALFCVRLLELNRRGAAEERLSYLIGCFISMDLDNLIERKVLHANQTVLLAGGEAVSEAWGLALGKHSIRSVKLESPDLESALLAGLRCAVSASLTQP